MVDLALTMVNHGHYGQFGRGIIGDTCVFIIPISHILYFLNTEINLTVSRKTHLLFNT